MNEPPLRVTLAVWPHASLRELVREGDVLVCGGCLLADARRLDAAVAVLDGSERERYERYENSEVARRFAVGRLYLREILGQLLGVPPAAVPIRLGLHGKPSLAPSAAADLRFSVAHCDDLMLVALTQRGEVGVDVERVRPIERWARVADRVFGPADRAALGKDVERGADPSASFFRFWCRGEAELKAIGSGISGLGAHRDGWHPAGLRVADLAAIPLPDPLSQAGVRYQGAVAVCALRDPAARHSARDPSQLTTPTSSPTTASTA